MELLIENFGGFDGSHLVELETQTRENGYGKTSIVNAYVFALSGRTLHGFEAVNTKKDPYLPTSVTLNNFLFLPPVRRVANDEGGTTLYVGGDVATQEDFVQVLKAKGYDLDLILACADASVLTSNSLDAATLRKLLSKTDVMSSDEYDATKKNVADLNKQLKTAEQYALTNVIIPLRTIEQLTEAERVFATKFKEARTIVNDGVVDACPHCKRAYEALTIRELTASYELAEATVKRDLAEFSRIMVKQATYQEETEKIEDATRLLAIGTKARQDVVRLKEEIATLKLELSTLDVENVNANENLPNGVEVVTEIMQKNGKTKPTCTLTYQGIPLRSVNHAKRVEIFISILNRALSNKGMEDVPIILDNAESVEHDFYNYPNVIRLYVAR